RNRRRREQLRVHTIAQEEAGRRVVDRGEPPREPRAGTRKPPDPGVGEPRSLRGLVEGVEERREARALPFAVARVDVARSRKQCESELAHRAPSSAGDRYESASARCSGSTSAAPESRAIVRATRDTRARPRPESGSRSTALASSSSAALVSL